MSRLAIPHHNGVHAGQRHYDAISVLPIRRWLKSGSLLEHKWILETDDPQTKRFTEVEIDFDVPLVGWPNQMRLTDPALEHDLITAKKLLFYVQEPKPLGWAHVAASAAREFQHLVQFIRWRLSRGIMCNADLTKEWHAEYIDSLKEGGSEGLLQMEPQASRLVEAFRQNELQVLVNDEGRVDGPYIARLMGVPHGNSITPQARSVLDAYFNEVGLLRTRRGRSGLQSSAAEGSEDPNENTVYKKVAVWHHLWRFRGKLDHDPIGCKIYHNKKELSAAIKGWTKRSEVTDDPPAYQTSWLINAALTLVLDECVSDIIEIANAGLSDRGVPNALILANSVGRRLKDLGFADVILAFMAPRRSREDDSVDLRRLTYEILPAACAIIITAFSARRAQEGMSLKSDCVEADENGDLWLNTLIEKGGGQVDRVPIPHSVKAAVDVLRKLKAIRPSPPGHFLFDFRCGFSDRCCSFNLATGLKSFSVWARVPEVDGEGLWPFAPHQLRKFFGVTYFWRYSFPSLIALSLQYRHFNPETTMGYITTKAKDMLRIWDESNAEKARKSPATKMAKDRLDTIESSRLAFTRDVYSRVASGETITGPLGKLITAQVDEIKNRFNSSIQLSQAESGSAGFEAALDALAASARLKAHPEGHGLCGLEGNLRDVHNANCLLLKQRLTGTAPQAATGPAFDFADDLGCLQCSQQARLPEFQNYWSAALGDLDAAMEFASPDQQELLRERRRIILAHAGKYDV
ncbi:hypothetical protein [Rhizobium sp. R86522]|uniref:hypothetical protein n=1 Tax=Rhizobium sp. R86522 TaxID=3093861 RepID=UPI0036709D58